MGILRERVIWRRSKPTRRPSGHGTSLTPEEQIHVRLALRELRTKYGTSYKLAAALGVSRTTVAEMCGTKRALTAEVAVRVAKLAGVAVTDILTGAWPEPKPCPVCGRHG